MKVASVEFSPSIIKRLNNKHGFTIQLERYIQKAIANSVKVLVFPGFTGCLYQWIHHGKPSLESMMAGINHHIFLDEVKNLSKAYNMVLCPGSYWERKDQKVYHSSCIISNGEILLEQSQIYLAKWERELLLARGQDLYVQDIEGWKIAIILATDVFYPQVARRAALLGAELIISPVGLVGEKNTWLQVSGTWQTTQLNHFFAVESAFNGNIGQQNLWGESFIHGPLPITLREDGILCRTNGKKEMIYKVLHKEQAVLARREFDVLKQLNPDFYDEIQGLGGNKNV